MTDIESFGPIKHKREISAYFMKQYQVAQWSYYSISKILFTIMSFSLPINTTSRIEEQRTC